MRISDIPVPEIYKESWDFRFFLKWFEAALSKVQYDTENLIDLLDPLRCPQDLLWMLADTMGFKYDNRLCTAFNRLVLVYFMSIIRTRGSKDGVTLAAEVNLAQFNINNYGKEKDILYNRLDDSSIPVNSVYVTPHVDEGYIDIVYFSENTPTDACIEYARPLGMYAFQSAGVRFDGRTKISVDARLTNTEDLNISIGPTHVGHYRRSDYARMQKMRNEENQEVNADDTRYPVWYRNSQYEQSPDPRINSGYRAMYSLQLCNNEHIMQALLPQVFGIGYNPQNVTTYNDNYNIPNYEPYVQQFNLRYDYTQDGLNDPNIVGSVETLDSEAVQSVIAPKPAVNRIMAQLGDAISLQDDNAATTKADASGNVTRESTVTP